MVPPLFLFQRLCRGKTLCIHGENTKRISDSPGRFDEKMQHPGTLKFGMNFGDGRLNRFELRLQFAGRTERITHLNRITFYIFLIIKLYIQYSL